MTVTIHIEGLADIQRMLSPQSLNSACEIALDKSSQVWRDNTKKLPAVSAKTTGYEAIGIPVDTGRLRQSIQARKVSAIAAEVYSPVQYAQAVHEGTPRMPARPYFNWSLEGQTMEDISVIFSQEILKSFAA